MDWARQSHPLERLVEWAAPLVLAATSGWSAQLARMPVLMVWGCVVIGLACGWLAMRVAGSPPKLVEPAFEPVSFDGTTDLDELSLDDPSVELLLDDPLANPASDSRVVTLFAPNDPTPGELVLRISDYLSDQGKEGSEAAEPVPQQVDASAALHEALANIRATLR